MAPKRLAIIGGGNLGGAFVAGFRSAPHLALFVVEPDTRKHAALAPAQCVVDLNALPASIDTVLVTVKPQLVEAVCATLAGYSPGLVVSFAAGVKLSALRKAMGPGHAIVRAMANTAAAFGASVSSLCTEAGVTVPASLLADLSPLGDVVVLQDEKQMDAAMALSGSAPAFILLAAEGLSDAGVRLGLSRELASKLAGSALTAAAAVAAHEHMTLAKHRISSPGGTTIEGLAVLESAAVRAAYADAAIAAARRAKELLG